MATKVINVKGHPFYEGKRAKLLSSLTSEGHILVGNLDTDSQLISYLRHPNGNRIRIIVTFYWVLLFVNGKLRKVEEIKGTQETSEKPVMCHACHVKNPKPIND